MLPRDWLRNLTAGLGVLTLLLACTPPASARFIVSYKSKKPCPVNCDFFGYYPTHWRPWPVVCSDPAPATMTIAPAEPDAPMPPEPLMPPKKNGGTVPSGAQSYHLIPR